MYVYQAAKNAPEFGLTSTVNPWPDVAAPSYQFPERAKSALVGYGVVVEQVTFCVRRVNGIVPVRPVPSVNVYDELTAGAGVETQASRSRPLAHW